MITRHALKRNSSKRHLIVPNDDIKSQGTLLQQTPPQFQQAQDASHDSHQFLHDKRFIQNSNQTSAINNGYLKG